MGSFTRIGAFAAALLSAVAVVSAATDIPSCGPGQKCPADSPCCSQYGQCGVGAYCLGGCDPLFSFDLSSCVPAATCKSTDYNLDTLNDVQSISDYLGDYSNTNWVASGNPATYAQGDNTGILLTMGQGTVGTLMATTHYVWYGEVSATLTTSQGAGVVTAFILMSDVKDEIDFEFVGVDINHAQSNYYSQGVTDYRNGENLTVSGDTVSESHTYTINWQPDTLTWSVDGKVLRTLNREDTWNSTANRYSYPQTPSRVMLSLWPAGLPTNGKGTIEWAGGEIDWNSPYMSDGYYYALVKDVTVKCYDPPSGAQVSGSKSYIYTDDSGTNNTVKIVDDVVVLKSLYANGDNPDYCPDCTTSVSSSSGTKPTSTSSTKAPSNTPQTIPGEVGAGGRSDESGSNDAGSSSNSGSGSDSGSSGSDGSSGSGTDSGSGSGTDSSGSANTGSGQTLGGSGGSTTFSQGDGSSGSGGDGSSAAAAAFESRMAGGSALAVVIALAAMLIM